MYLLAFPYLRKQLSMESEGKLNKSFITTATVAAEQGGKKPTRKVFVARKLVFHLSASVRRIWRS